MRAHFPEQRLVIEPSHLTEPLPFGDVREDSLPITSWISRRFSAIIKGMTSQEARRIVVPHW